MTRWLVVALLFGGGCARDDANRGPSCREVGSQAFAIAEHDTERAALLPDDARAIVARGPVLRDAVVAACARDRWSARLRECFAASRDRTAWQTCERGLTDEQRARIAATAAPSSW